jgi:hypothetical protein
MAEGTEHHLEHAEHSQHAAHHPFDRGVAMIMAIIAAILAGVTLVSHRGHTETLRLGNEATTNHTKASDEWNLYQAKNIRSHEYQMFLFLQSMLAKDVVKDDEQTRAMRQYWISQIDNFEGPGYWANFLDKVGKAKPPTATAERGDSKATSDKAEGKVSERTQYSEKATDLQTKAAKLEHQSHALHGNVTWIDLGHLGLELALVFCAIAVLTKQRSFLLTGICLAVIGSGVAGWGIVGWWMMGGEGGGHP